LREQRRRAADGMSRVNGQSITDSVAEQQAGDGRGNLSLKALTEFTGWFLRVCLDQVTVMTGLFYLDTIIARLKVHADRRDFRPEAFALNEQTLQRGELPRGEAARLTRVKERSARGFLSMVVADGVLRSESLKGAVSLRFPVEVLEVLFLKLFLMS